MKALRQIVGGFIYAWTPALAARTTEFEPGTLVNGKFTTDRDAASAPPAPQEPVSAPAADAAKPKVAKGRTSAKSKKG
jgi:hypothetical protein